MASSTIRTDSDFVDAPDRGTTTVHNDSSVAMTLSDVTINSQRAYQQRETGATTLSNPRTLQPGSSEVITRLTYVNCPGRRFRVAVT